MRLFSENRTQFYNLLSKHVEEFMPLFTIQPSVYDIEQYSQRYVDCSTHVSWSADRLRDLRFAEESAARW